MKHKITFILPSLRRGGAERVVSFVVNNLDQRLFDVFLIVIEKENSYDFKIDDSIKCVHLGKKSTFSSIIPILKLIKRFRSDTIFTSIVQLNILNGLFSIFTFRKCKFIAREASISSQLIMHRSFKEKLLNKAVSFFYNKLDFIICQSFDMKLDLLNIMRVREESLVLISNPITKIRIRYNPPKGEVRHLITVGRLSKEKGYDRLLEIISHFDFDFKYTIVGTGPLEENLRQLIYNYKLEEKVEFVNFIDDTYSLLKDSDLFLQGSFVEGFPNALLEAISLGVPAVAFDAPGGTREILRDGFNGFLVTNKIEFISKVKEALFSANFDSRTISDDAFNRYSGKNIVSKYQNLFLKK
ncbi:glycosyltransferase [Arachidicoccus ginsenosidivorans]|uniref:Glycosyltransferase n=1 Tax=Arachidicoccus ginsenosidivorans TaxID=496057 RepID=A0A5B8VQM7_9BACT|nr:glycosyltransferase [Arachidicoccus ginsenosidivorans]QEC73954.1 glycosyltransferase [Arachidicoccus ginsenosidivorans]